MTKEEIRADRNALGLSAEGFARLTGAASGRTVRRWDAGDNDVPGSVAQLLRLLKWLPDEQRAAAVAFLMAGAPPES